MAESHEERELAAHEGEDKHREKELHARLERIEKHLGIKHDGKSKEQKQDEAMRKRHKR
jgi:hypothetical protein